MQALLKLTKMELKLQFREPIALFFTLVFPVMLMIFFGSIFGNEAEDSLGGYGQVDLSVPGYIGMIIGTIGMLNIPVALANYRDQGILRRLRVTPLQSGSVLWAQVITQVVVAAGGIALLDIVGVSFYDLRIPTGIGNIIPAILLSAFSFFSVGFMFSWGNANGAFCTSTRYGNTVPDVVSIWGSHASLHHARSCTKN